jgi:hypothetical protein
LDEKLTKRSSVEKHIEDFKDSDAPQFKGKSQEKRRKMAVAAYLQLMKLILDKKLKKIKNNDSF